MPLIKDLAWAKAYIASHQGMPNLTDKQKANLRLAFQIVANHPLAPPQE